MDAMWAFATNEPFAAVVIAAIVFGCTAAAVDSLSKIFRPADIIEKDDEEEHG